MFDTPWILLTAAWIVSTLGLAWMALAMEVHWEQVRGTAPLAKSVRLLLNGLGWAALVMSLGLCLAADHASMAALVWIMLLSAGAVSVAFTLTWRPHWLALLVAWMPGTMKRSALE